MSNEDLLAALTKERYDNRWWTTRPEQPELDDSEIACARRRRQLAEAFEGHERNAN